MHALELFALGILLIVVTVIIHAYVTLKWMDYFLEKYTKSDGLVVSERAYRVLVLTAIVMLLAHMLEVLLWASAYWFLVPLSEIETIETAFYFSVVTFTSLGYGDITLESEWRILSGMEALNGVLLVGWTTAFLYAILQRIWKFGHQK